MTFRALAITFAAIAALSGPTAAQTVRPKPRPVLVAATAPVLAPVVAPVVADADRRPVGRPERPVSLAAPQGPELAPAAAPHDPTRGAVTNLPLPRYVSLKTGEGNARRGPGLTHRIDWRFTHAGMPLRITAEYEHWRRVEDAEGMGGWVHFALLSGVRSVLVNDALVDFHTRPDTASAIDFQAEAGVIGKVMECGAGWCRINIDGQKGWARTTALWGVDPEEEID